MELTRFVPARRRLTAAVAVGTMALTLAGLHAPGAGAASQQPPVCQSFTIAGAQGALTGPGTGEVQTAPIPGAQAGAQAGGVSTHGLAGQAGQPGQTEQPEGSSSTSSAPETVSCVAEVGGASDPMCVVTFHDATGQAVAAGIASTDAGTTAQNRDTGPSVNQALDPSVPATAPAGQQGPQETQGAQGAQGAQSAQATAGDPAVPAAEAGTGADVDVSSPIPGGTVATCGVVGGVGGGAPAELIENETTDAGVPAGAVPAVAQAGQNGQAPAGGCEETVLSETPLPSGGSIKVSMTPC